MRFRTEHFQKRERMVTLIPTDKRGVGGEKKLLFEDAGEKAKFLN